jgi:lipopolysaccharide export LptBFGC system permease protein LptF
MIALAVGILQRYLLRAVLSRLLLALPALALCYLAVDLSDGGRRLASTAGWSTTLEVALLHLPLVLVQTLPAALLLSAILALSRLRERGELEAIAAAGGSPLRLCVPLLLAGGIAAAAALGLDELVVPPCEGALDARILRVGGGPRSPLTGLRAELSRWTRHGRWFLRAEGADRIAIEPGAAPTRPDPRRSGRDQEPRSRRLERVAGRVRLLSFGAGSLAPATVDTGEAAALLAELERSRTLLGEQAARRPEAQSYPVLRRRLQLLAAAGQAEPAEELLLHAKLAFPALNLCAALLACGFALRPGRRSTAVDLGLGLLQTLGLFALLAGGFVAGRIGWLSPTAGAWSPVLVALGLGLLLLVARLGRGANLR